jgi:hypothetical protein
MSDVKKTNWMAWYISVLLVLVLQVVLYYLFTKYWS